MKYVDKLIWKKHKIFSFSDENKHAIVELDNGFVISVVTGDSFYCDKKNPYEAYVIRRPEKELNSDTEEYLKFPAGYLNETTLEEYIKKISLL